MNKFILIAAALLFAQMGFAQTDSTKSNNPDTIRVGNFIIVKKNKQRNSDTSSLNYDNGSSFNIHIGSRGKRYQSNISTNWFIFDLGFNNWNDRTDYGNGLSNSYLRPENGGGAFTKNDFTLRNVRSMNVNIWLFMQKLNITKHVVNLKYGLGINMYNYFFDKDLRTTYHKGEAYVTRDTVSFSKNKLATDYITVPFMININPTPDRNSLSFSFGVSAGYLYSSRNKQANDNRGTKTLSGDIGISNWRWSYVGEIGLGPVRLYGSYSINPLHKDVLKQYPYAFGIRFSNW